MGSHHAQLGRQRLQEFQKGWLQGRVLLVRGVLRRPKKLPMREFRHAVGAALQNVCEQ